MSEFEVLLTHIYRRQICFNPRDLVYAKTNVVGKQLRLYVYSPTYWFQTILGKLTQDIRNEIDIPTFAITERRLHMRNILVASDYFVQKTVAKFHKVLRLGNEIDT